MELSLEPTEETSYESFIGVWQLDPAEDFCNGIIKYFETSKEIPKQRADDDVKNMYQMYVYDTTNAYVKFLNEKILPTLYQEYCEKYEKLPMVREVNSSVVKIQRYDAPDDAYKQWHCERTNLDPMNITRHLVWMIYLNDIDEGGETEFYYQKLKIKPKAGKMLVWTPDWIHTHRGVPAPKETKYIATGWFNHRFLAVNPQWGPHEIVEM